MADTNTYIKQQNVKKYTTQNKFDSLDRTDIPVGTEYNIVGSIEESDLSATLASKVNTIDGKTGGSITGNLTIGGNLVVNGETTTVSSTTLSVKDKLIEVGAGNTVALTTPAGIFTPKYDGTNSGGLVYDNTGTAYVGDITLDSNGNVDVSNSELQPIATRDSKENFTDGNLVKWDSANERLIDGGSISSNLSNGSGISISSSSGKAVITNSGVRSISTGSTNGTISVNTNGTAANVAVKGLGSAAYTESSAYAKLASDNTFTGNNTFNKDVVIKAPHRDTYYASNLCRHFSDNTPTEFVIKTKIRFVGSTHMPVVRIYGYAYEKQSPIELRIGFYIFNYGDGKGNVFCCGGVSCTGAWKPNVYLFKYTEDNIDWVAIGFKGACYFCGFQVDAQIGASGSFGDYFQIDGWTTTHNGADTSVSLIPAVGTDKCIQVEYKPMQTDIVGNAATATKATQDSDGNVIKDTYVKLTGDQTVSGVKTFSDGIKLNVDSNSAYNVSGKVLFSSGARIGSNNQGNVEIYGSAIYLRPDSLESLSSNGIFLRSTNLSPTTTKNCSLGTSSLYWNNIYGTTIYQNGNKVLDVSSKGAASGLAELDSTGKVPSSQLPSYVDDVLEYSAKSSFPTTGETGKIYVDTTTNLTYRWSGSAYVEISPSLALGETSSTAYRGDRGKIAYDHSQTAHAPSNAEKNQNAFSNVVVGSTTIAADSATDTLTLVAGTNVTLTPDAENDKVTIAASDTKNTAGSTDTSSKIFLIGATSQAANPQTYSHDTAYVGTDGCLYSDGNKVATLGAMNVFTAAGNAFTDALSIRSSSNSSVQTAISPTGFSRTDGSSGYTYTLPSASGTIALTSNIPDVSNFVDLSSVQTISGAKTFSSAITASSSGMQAKSDSNNWTTYQNGSIVHMVSGTTYINNLPSKGGTFITNNDTMVGASSSAVGNAGLVPIPTNNDYAKFLCGDGTWKLPTDTKNTAGSSDTSSQIYLIGATSQATSATTYSHDTVYIDSSSRLTSIYKNTNVSIQNTIRLDPANQYIMVGSGGIGSEPGMYAKYSQSSIIFSPNGGTTQYTYSFPAKGGTFAMTSDLNSYVSLTGNQTIQGTKTFTARAEFNSGIATSGSNDFQVQGLYNISLPAKSGTLATTADIEAAITTALNTAV